MLSLALPVVWIILFSRMVVRKSFLAMVIASTAMGMEAETVNPGLEGEVYGRSAEENAKDAAHQHRFEGKLLHGGFRADEGLEFYISHDSPVFSRTILLSEPMRLKIKAEPITPAMNQMIK